MKKRMIVAALLAAFVFSPVPALASGLGIDLVRLVDGNQDDGMTNFYGQLALAGGGAVVAGYSSGDHLNIVDVAYKHYFGRYARGPFVQVGAGYYDGSHDDDLGFVGSLGYEHRIARHLSISGSARIVAGVDESIIGYREVPVFQPTLGVMLVF